MGNSYRIHCMHCKEYLYLGKENEFWQDKKIMYLLKDFLLSHTNHDLRVGGDEWNGVFPRELIKEHKEYDKSASLSDYNKDLTI